MYQTNLCFLVYSALNSYYSLIVFPNDSFQLQKQIVIKSMYQIWLDLDHPNHGYWLAYRIENLVTVFVLYRLFLLNTQTLQVFVVGDSHSSIILVFIMTSPWHRNIGHHLTTVSCKIVLNSIQTSRRLKKVKKEEFLSCSQESQWHLWGI